MAYRSWLKDVRKIQDLGPHCHNLSFKKPEDDARDVKYLEKWLAQLRSEIPVAPESQFAFGCRMHDSWIEWIHRDSMELKIRINNDLAQKYLETITDVLEIHIPTFLNTKYKWPHPLEVNDWVAPVELIFEDPVYVNAVRVGPSGELRWTDWETAGRKSGQWQADQYSREWFFCQDGRIQCIVYLWSINVGKGLSDELYLLIDCKKARATDYRESALSQVLTPLAGEIWREMISGNHEYKGWGHEYEFLENRLKHYGSTFEDLRPLTASSSEHESANA